MDTAIEPQALDYILPPPKESPISSPDKRKHDEIAEGSPESPPPTKKTNLVNVEEGSSEAKGEGGGGQEGSSQLFELSDIANIQQISEALKLNSKEMDERLKLKYGWTDFGLEHMRKDVMEVVPFITDEESDDDHYW